MRRFALSVPLGGLLFSAFAPVPASAYYGGIMVTAIVGCIDCSLKTRKVRLASLDCQGFLSRGELFETDSTGNSALRLQFWLLSA